jgi:hypothetical protein
LYGPLGVMSNVRMAAPLRSCVNCRTVWVARSSSQKSYPSYLLRKYVRFHNRLWDGRLMTTRSIFMLRGERSS